MNAPELVPDERLPWCPRCGQPVRSLFVTPGRRDRAEPCGHRLSVDEVLAVLARADELLAF